MTGRWGQKLLLVLVSTVAATALAWGAGEIFLRLRRPYFTPDTMREQSIEYEATVITRHAFPRMRQTKVWDAGLASATINARGYRGRDFAIPKPADLIRIVVLGGSSVFDTNARDGRDWPRQVEERLRANGLSNVEVINAGTPGHATWDALGRLYAEIWMVEPDYVLVYHAWNDIKYFSWLTPDNSLMRSYRPYKTAVGTDFVANPFIYYSGTLDRWLSHSQFYVRIRQGQWRSRIGPLGLEGRVDQAPTGSDGSSSRYPDTFGQWGPRQYQLTLRLIADAAHNIGAEPIFVTEARLATASSPEADRRKIGVNYSYAHLSHEGVVRAFEACDTALKAAAAAEKAGVFDLSAMLTGQTDLFFDLVHTNEAGSRVFANAIAAYLEPVLRARVHSN